MQCSADQFSPKAAAAPSAVSQAKLFSLRRSVWGERGGREGEREREGRRGRKAISTTELRGRERERVSNGEEKRPPPQLASV